MFSRNIIIRVAGGVIGLWLALSLLPGHLGEQGLSQQPVLAQQITTVTPAPTVVPPTPTIEIPNPAPPDPPLPSFPDDSRFVEDEEGEGDEEGDEDTTDRPPRRYGCSAAPQPKNPPRFLSLPFPADPAMEVYQGWHYTQNNQAQCGIDYTRREGNTLTGFPILAAADGEACADDDGHGGCVSGFGKRVLIRHQVDGQTYYTYYGHLETINPDIPFGNRSVTMRVRRGQVIGYAGDTGAAPGDIHLHFGIAAPYFGWYDPYDIFKKAVHYPDPDGMNGIYSGQDYFWTTNPPSNAIRADAIGGPEATIPADASAAGSYDLSEWTNVVGTQSGVVEIWINGEYRGEADYGPSSEGDYSTFEWRWDTSHERNGPHTVRLVAFAEDSSQTPILSASGEQEASFLVTVQNPWGVVESLRQGMVTSGPSIPINGWAIAEGSQISDVEIWINGEKEAIAEYGLPNPGSGGDYGFAWQWDTTTIPDGRYTVVVKALAENGGGRELPAKRGSIEDTTITITVENRRFMDKWTIR
jgi:hypothetical protein